MRYLFTDIYNLSITGGDIGNSINQDREICRCNRAFCDGDI